MLIFGIALELQRVYVIERSPYEVSVVKRHDSRRRIDYLIA